MWPIRALNFAPNFAPNPLHRNNTFLVVVVAMEVKKTRKIRQNKWFKALFGFTEEELNYSPALIRERFRLVDGNQLVSRVNQKSYGMGTFSTPSLGELRVKVSSLVDGSRTLTSYVKSKKHKLKLRHVAVGDVFELHASNQFAGATFMAASQTNCLEFASPRVVPELGVTGYVYDQTQGPACALAAPAATVFRNYFCETNGQVGQSEENQINIYEDLLRHIHGDGPELLKVKNGYTFSSTSKLQELNRNIPLPSDPVRRDEVLSLLRIGLHSNVEVPWNGRRFELIPPEERQNVTQVFCSAVSCGYSRASLDAWEPFARLVLDAGYEAVLSAAAVEVSKGGSGTVLLTFIGGGVFGNEMEWIEDAIVRACVKLTHLPLKVILCHYRSVDAEAAERMDKQIALLREQM